jgi:glucosylceramidase
LCIGTPDFTGTPWYSYCDTPPPASAQTPEDFVAHIETHFSIKPDHEFIIPCIKQALQRNPNLVFFASPWSPPSWMKDSGSMCGGKLLSQYYLAYARYFVKYLQAYAALGIPIKAVTVQNEPYHNVKSMPTCFWTGSQERDFIRDYLGPAFKAAKLPTEIWCYDHNWDDIPFRPARYPHVILRDPEARKYVQGIGWHHYSALGWSNPKLMIKHRRMLQGYAPDVGFYFTEGSLFGLWGSMRLSRYLKYGAQSYNGWVPMIDTEGKPNNGPFHATNTMLQRKVPENRIQINFDYWMFTHFSRFILPGSWIINTTHQRARGIESLGFQTPAGKIGLVLTNKNSKDRDVCITILHSDPTQKLQIHASLPPNSISTIIEQP